MSNARHSGGVIGAACFLTISLSAAPSASAEGWLDPPLSGGTQLHRGLDKAGLEALVTTLRESDRIAIDIDATKKPGCLEANRQCIQYDVVSTRNADGRKWRLEAALSPEQYDQLWESSTGQKMRPVDIEVTPILYYYQGFDAGRYKDEVKFAALFVENKENLAWVSYSKRTDLQYQDAYNSRVGDQGMTVVDYESYSMEYDRGPYFAVIFVKDKADRTAISQRMLSKDSFETYRSDIMEKGFRPLFVNDVGNERYAVTWLKDPEVDAKVFTALTLDQMNNKNAELTNSGYARVEVDRHDSHWGSVWMKRLPTRPSGAVRVNPAQGPAARVNSGQDN
jgi:hypothetical protein